MSNICLLQELESRIKKNNVEIGVQRGIVDGANHQILHKPCFGNIHSYNPNGQLASLRDESCQKIRALEAENLWLQGVIDLVLVV